MPEEPFSRRGTWVALLALLLGHVFLPLAHAAESSPAIRNIEELVARIDARAVTVTGEKELAGTDFPSSLKLYTEKSFAKIRATLGLSHLCRIETIYYEAEQPLLIIHEDKYYRRDENTLEFDTTAFSHVVVTKYYFVNGRLRYAIISDGGDSSKEVSEELSKKLQLEAKGFLKYSHSNEAVISID
jgi:hypothetical protein